MLRPRSGAQSTRTRTADNRLAGVLSPSSRTEAFAPDAWGLWAAGAAWPCSRARRAILRAMNTSRKQTTNVVPLPQPEEDPGFEPGADLDADETSPASIPLSQRALQRSAPPYFENLNPEQRAAIEALDGPVLVLAGAGTGKTRVLTTRIGHILATGRARGSEILAVTFTNKAAREMKERIGSLIGMAVEGMPWLGTFHSIGVRLLRRHAELVGLKSGFTILDTDDQLRLLKQLVEAEKIDAKRWPVRQLAGLIDGWKNRGLIPSKVPPGEGHGFAGGKG